MELNALSKEWAEALGPKVLSLLEPPLRFLGQEKIAESEAAFYPAANKLFQAFNLTPPHLVKVVILGQDPYHGPDQAQGLAFSVPKTLPLPPSLRNIFKELKSDLALDPKKVTPSLSAKAQSEEAATLKGDLTSWATQGVLLLNAVLSVRPGAAGSHQKIGWQPFTDEVIRWVSENQNNVVFILWGQYAHQKIPLIDSSRHLILTSVHPSPLSAHRGFFGSRPFSQTNDYLTQKGRLSIDWFATLSESGQK